MKCLINNDRDEEAIALYDNSNRGNKNSALHSLAIKAFANLDKFDDAQTIIDSLAENKDQNILAAMIYLYGRSKKIDMAWNAYNAIDEYQKDIVMANNMMYALHLNGFDEECLQIFKQLLSDEELDHLSPNIISYTNVLIACTNGNMLEFGKHIHKILNTKDNEWMLYDVSIQTNLIHMYNKCGRLDICKQIFFELRNDKHFRENQDIAVWNAMLQTYGDHGEMERALQLYNNLKEEQDSDLKPDKNTYATLINVYAQNGAIDEALNVWEHEICDNVMKSDSYIVSSLVNALSKKGMLDKAQEIMEDLHA